MLIQSGIELYLIVHLVACLNCKLRRKCCLHNDTTRIIIMIIVIISLIEHVSFSDTVVIRFTWHVRTQSDCFLKSMWFVSASYEILSIRLWLITLFTSLHFWEKVLFHLGCENSGSDKGILWLGCRIGECYSLH